MSEERILNLAEQLGKALSEAPQTTKLHQARKALQSESQTAQMLSDYHQQVQKIAQLEREQKPIEPDDKHKLQELEDTLLESDAFKDFTAAQVEYVELMRKVSEGIRKHLGEPDAIEA